MIRFFQVLCAVGLLSLLTGGLENCQPCEDPSQIFCQNGPEQSEQLMVISAPARKG